MWFARFALSRPYTVAASIILVCLLGGLATLRMPTDIFPEIDIPVVSVVWTYSGMSADEIQNRILVKHERQMASLVDDIARMEADQLQRRRRHQGVSARRRGCQPGGFAVDQQRADGAQEHAAQHHAAVDPPVWGDRRSDHSVEHVQPIRCRTQRMTDFGQQAVAAEPGGRSRGVGSVSIRRQAARDHGRPGHGRAAIARHHASGCDQLRWPIRTWSPHPAT